MSNPFSSTDIALAVFSVGYNFWQFSAASSGGRKWYEDARRKKLVYCAPPGVWFGIVWTTLYLAQGIGMYIYLRNFKPASFYTANVWLLLANSLVNKAWSWLFFDKGWSGISLLAIGVVIFPTAVLMTIFLALDGAWLSFGLWVAYPAWLVVALLLNWQWFSKGLPTNDPKEKLDTDLEDPLLPTVTNDASDSGGGGYVVMERGTKKTLKFDAN